MTVVQLPPLPRRHPGESLATFGPIAAVRPAPPGPAPVVPWAWSAQLLRSVAADIRRQGDDVFRSSHDLAAAGAELVHLIDGQLPIPVRLASLPPHTTFLQLAGLVEISLHAAAAEMAGEIAGARVLDEDIRSHVAYALGDPAAIAWPQGITCIDHAVQLIREGRLRTLLGLSAAGPEDAYGQLVSVGTCSFCAPFGVAS